jgi:tetratricopeptide (TPR) repeat protein
VAGHKALVAAALDAGTSADAALGRLIALRAASLDEQALQALVQACVAGLNLLGGPRPPAPMVVLDSPAHIATLLANLADLAERRGDNRDAEHLYARGLHIYRQLGERRWEARLLRGLGDVAAALRDYATARGYLGQSRAVHLAIGARKNAALVLQRHAELAVQQGEYAAGIALYEQSRGELEALGEPPPAALHWHSFGTIAFDRKDYDAARDLFQRSVDAADSAGEPLVAARGLSWLGSIAFEQQDTSAARDFFARCAAVLEQLDTPEAIEDRARALNNLGFVAEQAGDLEQARRSYEASLELSDTYGLDLQQTARGNLARLDRSP